MPLHSRSLLATAVLLAAASAGCSRPSTPPPASAAASAPPAQVVDIDVTEHVKTALHQSAALQGSDITVVTLNGDVRLTGLLDNQAQIDEAIRIARAAEGAHSIHDELSLRK
jgi:hypothetical protein